MNELFLITPRFREEAEVWVFDDRQRDLEEEPFVGQINDMIDWLVKDIPDAKKGFNLYFSAKEFPGVAITLERVSEDMGGNTYRCRELGGIEGWLCPALFRFFEDAPETIYGAAFPLRSKPRKQ